MHQNKEKSIFKNYLYTKKFLSIKQSSIVSIIIWCASKNLWFHYKWTPKCNCKTIKRKIDHSKVITISNYNSNSLKIIIVILN